MTPHGPTWRGHATTGYQSFFSSTSTKSVYDSIDSNVWHGARDRNRWLTAKVADRARWRRTNDGEGDVGSLGTDERQDVVAKVDHALLIGVVVHPTAEGDGIGNVGRRCRCEIVRVDAVGKPSQRNADVIALQRLQFRS